MLRKHRPGFAIALMGLSAALLALPATAAAERTDRRARTEAGDHRDAERRYHRDDDRGDHRHRAVRHRGHRHHRAHFWRGHGHGHRHHARHAAARHHEAPFYCKPCRNRFASRDGFHRHLRHRHRVASWRLPRVIVRHSLGWVFFG